jgi:RNA polymerase sigma-70 factor (ECF subfamily)
VIDWQIIIKKHGLAVWQTSYRLLGSAADAGDCFEETFVCALEVSQRQQIGDFGRLLPAVATARAIDRLRQRYRYRQVREDSTDLVFVPREGAEPIGQVQVEELAGKLRKALAQLAPKEADVFCLMNFNNMGYGPIAKELGIKRSTAKVLLRRAIAKLKNLLSTEAVTTKEGLENVDEAAEAMKKESIPASVPPEVIEKVTQKLPVTGGAEPQEVIEAKIRVIEEMKARRRYSLIAGAVVLALSILLGAVIARWLTRASPPATPRQVENHSKGAEEVTKTVKPEAVKEAVIRAEPGPAEAQANKAQVAAELKVVDELFAAGDVNGLMLMLRTGLPETKIAAAQRLGEIGDLKAATMLEEISAGYREGRARSPFAAAIAKIKARIKAESREANEVIAKEGTKKASVRREIHGWLVDVDGNIVQGRVWLGNEKATTEEDGTFKISEPTQSDFFSTFGRAFNAKGDLGRLFIWHKSDDANELEIVIESFVRVSGLVVDSGEDIREGMEIAIQPFMDANSVYKGDIGKMPWKGIVFEDGAFEVNSVPIGVPLQLTLRRAGFKTEIRLDNLSGGQNLDIGQVRLEAPEGLGEGVKWDCSLKGYVIDENNEPVGGAEIAVVASQRHIEAGTDANGLYAVSNLPCAVEMKMVVDGPGYGDNVFTYTCHEPGSETDLQIFPPAYDWYGKAAPGLFVSEWINTGSLTLEGLRGQVVLLYVGMDCNQPGGSIEDTKALSEKFKDRGLVVIGIHKRAKKVAAEQLRECIREKGINFACGIDEDSSVVSEMLLPRQRGQEAGLVRAEREGLRAEGATYSIYEVRTEPAYYLIDKKGTLRICATVVNVEEWIESLLEE